MSQERAVPASAVPLEELSSWPEELCRRELPSVLPRLLSLSQHSDSWIEHVQILKIIVEMFLPHMNHLTLEQTFFSQVLPKTVKLFDDMVYELTSQARGLSSQNLEIQTTLRNILQTMVQLLGALTGCVQHVCATQESIILENIQSLPSSVLHVIKSTFVHCKNSESVYSGRLHLVSDLLQALFKEAYSLQKQLMELLDMVCMDPSVDENDDILNMVIVIHSLLDICSVISSMDHAFHANTWKFIIKIMLTTDYFRKHSNCVVFLPTPFCTILRNFFLSSLILAVICTSCIFRYTDGVSLLLPRLECSGAILASQSAGITDLPCELQFPQCLLLVVVMDKLPFQSKEVQTLWCTDSQASETTTRISLLKAIFYSFEQCSGELSLPVHLQGLKSKGKAEVAVTLYQHVCVHLCTFITSFHPSLFAELDAALLNAVLSANMITSLLAMDAWCFLARYGTAELCAHHVTIVAHLIKSCPGECYQLINLSILLKRLFFFMAPPHQLEFIHKFSPKEAENLPLWQHISFQALPAELRKQTVHEVSTVGTAECRKWLSSSRTLGELESLNTVLSALLTICNSAGEALDTGKQTAIMEVVSQLWAFLNIKQIADQPYIQQTFSLLLPLLGFFIQTLDPKLIVQVVTLQTSLLKLEPPDYVRLAMLDFVSSLGKLFIPEAIQDRILPNLSCIFALLLADRSWLLEQHTLEAFTQFAEGTNHEEIVPQCLSSEETKNKVVSFLEKTGFVDETEAAKVERVKQEKGIFWECFANVTVEEAKRSPLQPYAKRARQEFPWEEEYRSALHTIAGALEATESLLQKGPAPAWLLMEMEALHERMDKLKRYIHTLGIVLEKAVNLTSLQLLALQRNWPQSNAQRLFLLETSTVSLTPRAFSQHSQSVSYFCWCRLDNELLGWEKQATLGFSCPKACF
uniref:FIGNL1 interacting regulator of recombination and mitosis n=1 Tax=Papio anubis TaxID=9555 RepID=A0A8I5NG34_PAPAN